MKPLYGLYLILCGSSLSFMKEQLLRILGSFACIIGALQIPMAVTVQKIKTIDLMED